MLSIPIAKVFHDGRGARYAYLVTPGERDFQEEHDLTVATLFYNKRVAIQVAAICQGRRVYRMAYDTWANGYGKRMDCRTFMTVSERIV